MLRSTKTIHSTGGIQTYDDSLIARCIVFLKVFLLVKRYRTTQSDIHGVSTSPRLKG